MKAPNEKKDTKKLKLFPILKENLFFCKALERFSAISCTPSLLSPGQEEVRGNLHHEDTDNKTLFTLSKTLLGIIGHYCPTIIYQ